MTQSSCHLKKVLLGLVVFTLIVFTVFTQLDSVSFGKTISDSVPWLAHLKFRNEIKSLNLKTQPKHMTSTTTAAFSVSRTITTSPITKRHVTSKYEKMGADAKNHKPNTHNFKDEVAFRQTKKDSFVALRFRQRLDHLNRMCEMSKIKHLQKRYYFLNFGLLKVCPIEKVGSSFTKLLIRNTKTEARSKADKKEVITFVFVRDPYSRLVSAYLGKIVTQQVWWLSFGTYIVQNFRLQSNESDNTTEICGNDVSFPEFIKYVIHAQHTGLRKNGHFTPLVEHCGFCSVEYDFLGHLETINEDLPFILKVGNITTNVSMNNEESTMRNKAETIIKQRRAIKKCADMCKTLENVWWSFQARGYIATDLSLPLSRDECDTISPTQFADISLAARLQSVGKIDKKKQKRAALVELFLQVPLQDRLELKNVLMKDFEFFGYDSQPPDLFPELVKKEK